jgi:hypothetical protein
MTSRAPYGVMRVSYLAPDIIKVDLTNLQPAELSLPLDWPAKPRPRPSGDGLLPLQNCTAVPPRRPCAPTSGLRPICEACPSRAHYDASPNSAGECWPWQPADDLNVGCLIPRTAALRGRLDFHRPRSIMP